MAPGLAGALAAATTRLSCRRAPRQVSPPASRHPALSELNQLPTIVAEPDTPSRYSAEPAQFLTGSAGNRQPGSEQVAQVAQLSF